MTTDMELHQDVLAEDGVPTLAGSVCAPGEFPPTDTDIAQRIIEAMARDVGVPHSGITPKVVNGWVTLVGDVDWQYQREAAACTVRCLAGVRGLTNALRVKGARDTGA